jgi:hypothetical protein
LTTTIARCATITTTATFATSAATTFAVVGILNHGASNGLHFRQFRGHFATWNRLANKTLNIAQKIALGIVAERDCDSSGARAASAANAMHISLGVNWQIIINDMRNGVHVKSSRGDIRRNKNTRASRTETIKRFGALTLRFVAVNGVGFFATRAQALGNLV